MIEAGELDAQRSEKAWETTWRITWPQLAALALDVWGIETIERELGEEAAQALPPLVRTSVVTLRLPRYQVVMLGTLAEIDGIGASQRVTDALLALAVEHVEELEKRIPGFADAMKFPDMP